MILEIADWRFWVDLDKTRAHTENNAREHCECSYCKNYYETALLVYPQLYGFLQQFGIHFEGPSELLPFEPDFLLACYRVQGEIIQWGTEELIVNGIPVLPETTNSGSFFLWIGEMSLPWVQAENLSEVISPANLPEFMERMRQVWQFRHGSELMLS